MSIIYLGPWEWINETWVSPGETAVGVLDKRSNTQSALAGGTPQGAAFFSYPNGVTLPSGGLNLGSDIERQLTVIERDGLFQIAGITAQSDDSIKDAIYGSYLNPVNYDASGGAKCKPLRMSRHDGLHCYLEGFGNNGLIINESFSPDHVSLTATLEARHVDYRLHRELPDTLSGAEKTRWVQSFRTKAERVGNESLTEQQARDRWLDILRRWNNTDSRALFGVDFDVRVLPTGQPGDDQYANDGWLLRQTVITESFNTADSDILGPDLTWTEVSQDIDIVSNEAQFITDTGGTAATTARAESALNSDDHYTEVVVTALTAGTNNDSGGVALRFHSSDNTHYALVLRDAANEDTVGQIFKKVTGTPTSLGLSATQAFSFPDTIRGHMRVDILQLFLNGTQIKQVTDTTIPNNLYTGIVGNRVSTDTVTLDDFKAADLPVTAEIMAARQIGGEQPVQIPTELVAY